MTKKIIIVVLIIISFATGYGTSRFFEGRSPQIVKISEPLKISNEEGDSQCLLPKNTVLYYSPKHTPKGESFSSYKVYINLHGKPFKHTTPEKKWYYSPITVFRGEDGV